MNAVIPGAIQETISGLATGIKSLIRALVVAWRASHALTVAGTLLTLAAGLLPIVFIIVTGLVVDAVPPAIETGLDSPNGRRLLTLLALLGFVYLLQTGSNHVRVALTGSLGSLFALSLRQETLEAALSPAGVAHLERPSVVDELEFIRGDVHRWEVENFISNLSTVSLQKVSGLGSLAILASFRWWAPLPILIGQVLAYLWVTREVDTFFASFGAETPGLRRAAYLRDLAVKRDASKELRIFGFGGWLIDRLERRWVDAMRPIWRDRKGHLGPLAWWVLAEFGGAAIVFTIVARAAAVGSIGIGSIAVLVQAVETTRNLGPVGDPETRLRRGLRTIRRIGELEERLRAPEAMLTGNRDPQGLEPIRFEEVTFAYPDTSAPVLNGLTLDISPGRSLAIVGLNGAGKTTLVKLLARLYDPDKGRISVGGEDLRTLNPTAWRHRMGVIFQDFIRFDLPARANVGFGAVEMQENTHVLERAAVKAGARELVRQLPHSWETILSRGYEGGIDLSGGEWQRIALARALMAVEGGADILVLDEPTANLDVRAEAELFNRFLDITEGVTTLFISHRFSTVRQADRIVVVEGGRVVEEGTHEELVATKGAYARLFQLQSRRFNSGARMGKDGDA